MVTVHVKDLVMEEMRLVGRIGDRGVNAVWNVVVDNNSEREVANVEIVMEHRKWRGLVTHTLAKVSGRYSWAVTEF